MHRSLLASAARSDSSGGRATGEEVYAYLQKKYIVQLTQSCGESETE
jgi:hypothetical protein